MKAVTADQIRELDQRAIAAGVSGRVLMEAAGLAVHLASYKLDLPRKRWPCFHCLVLAYKGNNGGDALAAARQHLENAGVVQTAIFCAARELKGDTAWHYRKLKSSIELEVRRHGNGEPPIEIVHIVHESALEEKAKPQDAGIIIDGLFGTGLKRPLSWPFDEVVRRVNASGARVVAVDISSGLNANTGEPMGGIAIRADVTVTMGLPKIGLLKEAAIDYVGKLVVAKLPYPPELIEQIKTDVNMIHEDDVRLMLPRRKFSSHKGDFGHALIVAGSQGLTGAANLCATACARTGAGLTTLCVPENVYPILAAACPPEVMVQPISDATIESFASRYASLGCGCGLGQSPEAKKLVENLIRRWPSPMVLDADALNNIAANPKILLQAKAPVIITPHPSEMARLTGKTATAVNADRWNIAKTFAREHKCIVVLKGARTVVTDGNELWINVTGNPAMASGGVGDALTGILTGLLAQGLKPFDAARAGVYLHGLAGNLAHEKLGGRAILASDLIEHLNAAFATIA